MKTILLTLLIPVLMASECDHDSSDAEQRREQERLNKQGNAMAGMPSIVNYQEKKLLKMILELRDSEKLNTYTYITDLNGGLHMLCRSIGFGIPYATQYTNPQCIVYNNATLPQADPNGLFSPASADGTWVLCFNPETKKTSPTYVEPRIIVSTFPLVKEKKESK